MNLKPDASSLADGLQMPTGRDLLPYLEKLLAHPGSAIIIGIEIVDGELRVGRTWVNSAERSRAPRRHSAGKRREGQKRRAPNERTGTGNSGIMNAHTT